MTKKYKKEILKKNVLKITNNKFEGENNANNSNKVMKIKIKRKKRRKLNQKNCFSGYMAPIIYIYNKIIFLQ